jgi:hypothetical protein
MTTTNHEFCLRFRATHEAEGQGSLLVSCDTTDQSVTIEIRRAIVTMQQQHPTAQFDGMVYFYSRDLSNR